MKLRYLLFILLGAILSAPFFLDVFVFEHYYHRTTFISLAKVFGVIVGQSAIVYGFVKMVARNVQVGNLSSAESDLARIRFAAENEARKKQ
jgi:hypothetical protein